ncbi:MAG: hypothetical protein ACX98W_02835 [bacterium]
MFTIRKLRALLAVLLLTLSTPGCIGSLGPRSVELTRNHYNMAAQETTAQELLMNLVRLRYRDTPYFLQIASLSSNLKLGAELGASGSLPSSGPRIATIEGIVGYEESPTVTYVPLVGDRFVSQLLEPVDLGVLMLLSHSGWSVDRFLRLLVQEINGIPNAPSASGPTPTEEPVFEEFLRVAELFRILQRDRRLALTQGISGMEETQTPRRTYLHFTAEALETPEFRELARRLRLEEDRRIFELAVGLGSHDPTRITIVPRSVLSALFYASQGVEVPLQDLEEGRVTRTRRSTGQPFDWQRLTGSLIRIRSGDPPKTVYSAIRYRGSLFYIDDSDLESKSTFSMLNLVLALQAGDLPSTGPLPTLPVSQ